MYENTPVLVAAYDSFDRLRYANQAFRSSYFVEPEETPFWSDLMRRNFWARRGTVLRTADLEAWLMSAHSLRGKTEFRAFETDLVDGRWFWMTETVQNDGWMLCIASDITGLRADERSVRQDRDLAVIASHTDELTGIANRRFVMARIEDMLRGDTKDGASGCLGSHRHRQFQRHQRQVWASGGGFDPEGFRQTDTWPSASIRLFRPRGWRRVRAGFAGHLDGGSGVDRRADAARRPQFATAHGATRFQLHIFGRNRHRSAGGYCRQPLRAGRQGALRSKDGRTESDPPGWLIAGSICRQRMTLDIDKGGQPERKRPAGGGAGLSAFGQQRCWPLCPEDGGRVLPVARTIRRP